ncbi:MAG TPA: hypothetical protein VFJ16_30560 [Longimicrobium sp.]|nr:hypothetical protein [Longimicrobium sp.]
MWLFLLSAILVLVCMQRRRSWKAYNDKAFRFFLYDRAVELLMPLTVVTLLYSLAWAFVEGTSDEGTLKSLEDWERSLKSARAFVSHFTFKPWVAAGIILALLIADLVIVRYVGPSDLAAKYKHYHRWSKRVFTFVSLLGAFSFFGGAMETPIAHLRLHMEKIASGYGALRKEAEGALNAAVQRELYQRIRVGLSPEVREVLDDAGALDDSLAALRTNYAALRPDHPYIPAERLIGDYRTRGALARAFGDAPIRYDDPSARGSGRTLPSRSVPEYPPDPVAEASAEERGAPDRAAPTTFAGARTTTPVPPDLTAESVDNARAALRASRPLREQAVALLRTSGGKQLLCQFPKSLTSAAKSTAFSAIVDDYPILGPIIDVFIGAFDKSVETRVERATDRVVDALVKEPAQAEEIISQEAREIASSAPLLPPPTLWSRIRAEASSIRSRIGEIVRVSRRVSSMLAEEPPRPFSSSTELWRDPGPDRRIGPGSENEIVDCYCGARFVGKRPRYLCRGPCRL